jgi:hypothetical protein
VTPQWSPLNCGRRARKTEKPSTRGSGSAIPTCALHRDGDTYLDRLRSLCPASLEPKHFHPTALPFCFPCPSQ